MMKQLENLCSDVSKIKAVLVQKPDADNKAIFDEIRYSDENEFAQFARKLLEDRSFGDLFVSKNTVINVFLDINKCYYFYRALMNWF